MPCFIFSNVDDIENGLQQIAALKYCNYNTIFSKILQLQHNIFQNIATTAQYFQNIATTTKYFTTNCNYNPFLQQIATTTHFSTTNCHYNTLFSTNCNYNTNFYNKLQLQHYFWKQKLSIAYSRTLRLQTRYFFQIQPKNVQHFYLRWKNKFNKN